jgi:hypothetical protein
VLLTIGIRVRELARVGEAVVELWRAGKGLGVTVAVEGDVFV